MATPRGYGPRHLVWHPRGRLLLSCGELHGSATLWRRAGAAGGGGGGGGGDGGALLVQCGAEVSIAGCDQSGELAAAAAAFPSALRLSSDGQFAYAATRGRDTVAVLAVEGAETGTPSLRALQRLSAGDAAFPRDLWVGSRWLVVGGQHGGGLRVWARDPESGRLSGESAPLASAAPFGAPVCFLAV